MKQNKTPLEAVTERGEWMDRVLSDSAIHNQFSCRLQSGAPMNAEQLEFADAFQELRDANARKNGTFATRPTTAPRVTTVKHLTLGQLYSVPCAVLEGVVGTPIFDQPLHDDRPLLPEANPPHYHPDGRFQSARAWANGCDIKMNRAHNIMDPEGVLKIVWMDRFCMHLSSPLKDAEEWPEDLWERFQETYKNIPARVDADGCLRCPHQGAPLNASPIEIINGQRTVRCASHNLRFNADTGRLVKVTQGERHE